jgi:phosphate starvation-inducible PhoH-like protein
LSEYSEQDNIIIEIALGDNGQAASILGGNDQHLRLLERMLDLKFLARGGNVRLEGRKEEVEKAQRVLEYLKTLAQGNVAITTATVNYAIVSVQQQGILRDDVIKPPDLLRMVETIYTTARGKQIKPKTLGQSYYLEKIRNNDLVFAIGPAGTGKTYLAVVMAINALKNREVAKIVLARPAVEAGEKLGFLPGDLQDKVNPYMRPIYDALDEILGQEKSQKFTERNIIEVVPLAYMRGRTLDDAFIILDEAQNTTPLQMKMFLTRMGMGSKTVITGDITQIDLPFGQISGLIEAERVLSGIKDIAFCYLTQIDVVRHPLVQKIIEAYEKKQKVIPASGGDNEDKT